MKCSNWHQRFRLHRRILLDMIDCVSQPGLSAEMTSESRAGSWWMTRLTGSVSLDGDGWVTVDYIHVFNTG